MENQKEKEKLIKQNLKRKYSEKGFAALSEKEIITLILSYTGQKNIEASAQLLLEQYGSLKALADADFHSFCRISALDEQTLVFLKLIPQLTRRYYMNMKPISALASSFEAKKYFENHFIGIHEEQFAAACTNEVFRKIVCSNIFCGTEASVNVSCREIADFALMNSASMIFIAHNHPDADAEPSSSDYAATDLIFRTLQRLGIVLIDHIVVGRGSTVSMRELPYTLPFKKADSYGYIVGKA